MKHKWEKETKFTAEKDYSFKRKELEKHKCTVCGCIRTKVKFRFKKYTHMEYERSGTMIWDRYAPECIDWNDNKLD